MSITTVCGPPLETLASEISARIRLGDRDTKKGEEHYLAAGIQLIEAQGRVRAELPGTPWLTWTAVNIPGIRETRIRQLMQIGRGETTQAVLNAASSASRRYTFAEADEIIRNWRKPDACESASATQAAARARDAERQRKNRAERNAARVAAGANVRPPLAPIEHRRLLKKLSHISARLAFDDLVAVVSFVEATVGTARTSEKARKTPRFSEDTRRQVAIFHSEIIDCTAEFGARLSTWAKARPDLEEAGLSCLLNGLENGETNLRNVGRDIEETWEKMHHASGGAGEQKRAA